ncbi:MAG: hypothetical protein IIC22_04425 [Chloroflexi bacterium]|nr:hypothetical protein [Chloroflexota bacterium]
MLAPLLFQTRIMALREASDDAVAERRIRTLERRSFSSWILYALTILASADQASGVILSHRGLRFNTHFSGIDGSRAGSRMTK